MDGIQTIIALIVLAALHLLTIPILGTSLYLLNSSSARWSRRHVVGLGLLSVAAVLCVLLYGTLAAAPPFDFIDRCKPTGNGRCAVDQSVEEVQRAILGDLLLATGIYIVLPLLVGSSIVWASLRYLATPNDAASF